MNWDGAVSMSSLLGMGWVSIQGYNSNATVCQGNRRGLVLFEILEGAHCSSVMLFHGGLASWALGVTALLTFLLALRHLF